MPSLKLCHRRWSFASDDLLIPACLFVLLHSLCLLCLVVVAVLHIFSATVDYNCVQPNNLDNTTTITSIFGGFCPSYIHPVVISLCSVILVGAFLLEIAIAYYSSQGTIMNATPRQRMIPFLGTRYVFISAEISFVAFTYVWFYGCSCVRHSPIAVLILAIAICENVVVVLLPLFAFCSYDVSGAKWYRLQKAVGAATAVTTVNTSPMRSSQGGPPGERTRISHTKKRLVVARQAKEAYAQSWFKQFNCWFCCLGSERRSQQTTFLEVAKLFGEIFGDTDLVGTDFIAGLLLLRRAQKRVIRQSATKRLRMLSGVPVAFLCDDSDEEESPSRSTSKAMMDPDQCQEDCQLLFRIVRIFTFAYSATGWPFYSLRNPSFLITAPLSCQCCRRNASSNGNRTILHDNLCEMNTKAALGLTQLPIADLVYADFEAAIGETAFIVMLDQKLKAVIVSVRGTLSLSDVLTDLNADSAKIPFVEEGSPSGDDCDNWVAHKGMLAAAIALKDRLINDKILEHAFAEAERLYGGNFSLILSGHSLGAGVAALIGILLKPTYRNLHVFAFSPPGGLLGVTAARYTQSFVTSVILGKDIVPRIGIRQIEAMRADIVNVLKACNRPKWSVIGNAAFSCCFGRGRGLKMDEIDFSTIKTMRNASVAISAEDTFSESVTPPEVDLEFGPEQSEKFFQQQQSADMEIDTFLSREEHNLAQSSNESQTKMGIRTHHHQLQLPGTIYHIVRQWRAPRSLQEKGRVELKLVKTCRNVYDHVIVSPRMVADHMPNGLMDAFEALAKQYKLDVNNLTSFNDSPC